MIGFQLNQSLGKCKLKPQYDNILSTKIAEMKKKENTKYGEDVEQLEVSCSASRRVNWYNHFEKSFWGKNLTENIYVVHIL